MFLQKGKEINLADISIIIPCYNVEKYIDRCLESVIEQTFPLERLEIICVNDGSTDGTLDKLKLWEKRYTDNIIVVEAKNCRSGGARNIGLEYSSAKWIAFVDSDDWLEPSYLKRLYDIGEDGDYEVVNCGHVRDKSTTLSYLPQESKEEVYIMRYLIDTLEKRKEFFHAQCLKLYVWGKLIQKQLLLENRIFFKENLAYEDIAWGNLLHLYVKRAANISEKLYHYFVNDNSLVLKKNADYHVDHLVIVEEMWSDWEERGFIDTMKDEFEYEYYYNGYLSFLKILALRYDSSQYSLFKILQKFTQDKHIDIEKNKYLSDENMPAVHRELINSSIYFFTKEQYDEFIEVIKKLNL